MSELEFRELKLEDRQLVNNYFAKSDFMGSEYSFPSLFIWRHKYNYKISEYKGFLIIAGRNVSKKYYLFPAGNGDLKEAIEIICKDAKKENSKCVFAAITKENVSFLEKNFPRRFKFLSNRIFFDYIYDAQSLINLSGQKYKIKRNHINRFILEYGEIKYEDINSENLKECRKVYYKWLEDKKDKGEEIESFSDEISAMEECFSYYEEIGLVGGLVRAVGNLCSFSFGSRINSNTLGIHIEKSLIDCQGGYAVINREFAKRYAVGYKYINREEDLGIKGLRQAKLSYRPVFLLEKYTGILKEDTL